MCVYPAQYRAVEIDLNIQGIAQLEITLPVLLNGRGIIMAGSHRKYLQGEIPVSLVCLFEAELLYLDLLMPNSFAPSAI